ncbi:hypothetical protein [Brevundimonas sp.]|uniref:hypothetical protein n=1 Tax=Brevundimonas sp. TaxID=1871086 RepID=UPI002EDAB58B
MDKAQIKALFHQRVLGAYERYRDLRDARRTGMNRLKAAALELATALHHFPELLPTNLGWRPLQSAELTFVAELSNAAKHGVRERGKQTYVNRLDSINEVAIETLYEDEIGRYSDAEVRVIVSCLDGEQRDADPFLISSLNQWIAYLSNLNVTPALELISPPFPGSAIVLRENIRSCVVEVNLQTDLSSTFQLQRFDPVTSTSHALPREGGDFQFRVYAPPPVELVLTLTSGDGSQKVEAAIILTAAEAADLRVADKLGLREAMMAKIADHRREEIQAVISQKLQALTRTE